MQYEIRVQIKVAMEATNFGNSVTKAKIYVAINELLCYSIHVLTKVSILITNVNKLSLSQKQRIVHLSQEAVVVL